MLLHCKYITIKNATHYGVSRYELNYYLLLCTVQ